MIIGLSGYAGAGKDTVANILVEKHGYRRVAFADKIREALFTLDPFIAFTAGEPKRLSYLFDMQGWEATKKMPEVRRLMQVLGTEVGRDLIDPYLWLEMALKDVLPSDKVVVTDVRFRNEAAEIKWKFGEVWRIHGRTQEPINGHSSETAMDDWEYDHFIPNIGGLDLLERMVEECLK